jgi:capsular polysaccharide transport system permease protein
MHGSVTSPGGTVEFVAEQEAGGWRSLLWRRRYLFMLVLLPTLVTALYYTVFAADQYESEAHLLVRSASDSGSGSSSGGLAQLLGGSAKGGDGSVAELADFLASHDAVVMLQKQVDLTTRFQRPEADALSRLRAKPTLEDLIRYFQRQVSVTIDAESGVATVRARSFRPRDSYIILNSLLALGEQRVNAMNRRMYGSILGSAQRQVAEAELNARNVERELAQFRTARGDIDPQGSGEAQTKMVTDLSQQLALARAQLGAVRTTIGTDNPQYQALSIRVASLRQQTGMEKSMLVGGDKSIASGLADYAELKLRQDFAAKRYAAAAGSLEKARDEALRQQLFVTRLVEPNMPEKALYPKKLKNVATVFALLMIFYGIGWLLLAGVREHAA